MPTLKTIGGVLAFLVYAYLLHRQNKIMEEQNRIMLEQGGAARRIANERTWWDKHWPMFVMAGLTLVTWSAVGFYFYDRHNAPVLYEFDDPRSAALVSSYGQDAPGACNMVINTSAQKLVELKSEYKLAIACFVGDGTRDILDTGNLQISQLYDIKGQSINVRIVYSDAFNQYRNIHGAIGSNIALLVVPNDIDVSQVQTLRQARALKILIPQIAAAVSASVIQVKPH
jgi:hypothetical protein